MSAIALLCIVAATTVVVALAVPAWRHWQEPPSGPSLPSEPVRSTWLVPSDLSVGAGPDFPFGLALAPDGRRMVFPAARAGLVSLWLHDLRSGDMRLLPDTHGAALPFWSPDGTRIGYFAAGKVRALELSTGATQDMATAASGRGAAWGANGLLVMAADATGGLTIVDASGATRPLTQVDREAGETSHRLPVITADGRWVVFHVSASRPSRQGIWITSLDNPTIAPRRLVSSDGHGVVVADRLLYASGDALVAQPIDLATGALTTPTTVLGMPVGIGPNHQLLATAAGDALVFAPPGTALRDVVWTTAAGARVATLGEPADTWDVRIAPDGRRVAVTQIDAQLRALDIWIYDGRQRLPLRVSPSTDVDESPAWSPDGHRVAWVSGRRAVTTRGAGAVLPDDLLLRFDEPVRLSDWSDDGGILLVTRAHTQTRDDIWRIDAARKAAPAPVVVSPFSDIQGTIAPDGRWLAYASDESGHYDVYVDTFPTPSARVRVTLGGGLEPRWSHDGGTLLFRRGTEIHAATIERVGAGVRVSALARLFDAGSDIRSFDVSGDGRFLLNVAAAGAGAAPPTMVLNWRAPANTP